MSGHPVNNVIPFLPRGPRRADELAVHRRAEMAAHYHKALSKARSQLIGDPGALALFGELTADRDADLDRITELADSILSQHGNGGAPVPLPPPEAA